MRRIPGLSGPVLVGCVALTLGVFVGACGTPTFDVVAGDGGQAGTFSHGPDSGLGHDGALGHDAGAPLRDARSPHDAVTLRDAIVLRKDDASPVVPDGGQKEHDAGGGMCAMPCPPGTGKCANGPDGCEMSCVAGCCVFDSDTYGKPCSLGAGGTGTSSGVCDEDGTCFMCVPGYTGNCMAKTCMTAVCGSGLCAYADDDAGTPCTTTLIPHGMCGAKGGCNL